MGLFGIGRGLLRGGPRPLYVDTFGMLSGAWQVTHGTLAAASGLKAATLADFGPNLVSNGSMETGDPPTGWELQGANSVPSRVSDERTGGAGTYAIDVLTTTTASGVVQQTFNAPLGVSLHFTGWHRAVTRGAISRVVDATSAGIMTASMGATTWGAFDMSATLPTTNGGVRLVTWSGGANDQSARYDDIAVYRLHAFAYLDSWLSPNIRATLDLPQPAAGVVPFGWAIRYVDSSNLWYVMIKPNTAGTDLSLIEVVAGVETVRATADIDWTAGATDHIRITAIGTTIAVEVRLSGEDVFMPIFSYDDATTGAASTYHGPLFFETGVVRLSSVSLSAPAPLPLPTLGAVTRTAATRFPIGVASGVLYGGDGVTTKIYRTDDYCDTWSEVANVAPAGLGAPVALHLLPSGEVLVLRPGAVQKSSGWAANPATATWTTVLTPNAWFPRWGLAVSGDLALVSEYASGPRDPSRYVWLSTDAGDTFTPVLDLDALFPGEDSDVHWHGVGIDPWTSPNRLWALQGDPPASWYGAYYSDDLGANWTRMADMNLLTTIAAAARGMVVGSDQSPQGLLVIPRTADPADMVLTQGDVAVTTMVGCATNAYREPNTMLVYVCFEVDAVGYAYLGVSDGWHSRILYATATTVAPYFYSVFVIGNTLIAHLEEAGSVELVRGTLTFS